MASPQEIKRFLASLHQVAQQAPAPGSVPLLIDAVPSGYASPGAFEVISKGWPNLVVDGKIELVSGPDLTERMAPLAQAIFDAGYAGRWRNERLDLWCGDNAVGAIERGVVRSLGLLTRAVHLNAWSDNGHLWVARRALDKATDPGLWDTLVGGLVGHAESDDLALERESFEEAGLSVEHLAAREPLKSIFRMRRRVSEGYQFEEVLTADCVLGAQVVPKNQDGEVMQISCLAPAQVAQMLLDDLFTVEAGIVIAQGLLARWPH